MDFQMARFLIENDVPPQAGNNHPKSTPTGVFKTKDGHVNIAAGGQPRTGPARAVPEPGRANRGERRPTGCAPRTPRCLPPHRGRREEG